MRQQIVAGNWKMNKTHQEAIDLTIDTIDLVKDIESPDKIILLPPFVHIKDMNDIKKKLTADWEQKDKFHIGGQNCHWEDEGSFTGEVSAAMLESVGATHVVIGHSERREYFNEEADLLSKKVDIALQYNLTPIFCCGESLEQRDDDQHKKTVQQQVEKALFHLSDKEIQHLIIGYEPVWAIGTGETATPDQAQEMHQHIRSLLQQQYNQSVADNISILYGGSCKPHNASDLFLQPDIDGGLIGGASLQAKDFADICKSFD